MPTLAERLQENRDNYIGNISSQINSDLDNQLIDLMNQLVDIVGRGGIQIPKSQCNNYPIQNQYPDDPEHTAHATWNKHVALFALEGFHLVVETDTASNTSWYTLEII